MAASMSASFIFKISILVLIICVYGDNEVTTDIQDVTHKELTAAVEKSEFLILVLYTEKCAKCDEGLEELKKMSGFEVVKCKDPKVAEIYGVKEMPKVIFFRNGIPILFDASTIDAEALTVWMEANLEPSRLVLNDDNFEHLTQAATGATTGHWFVLFYEPQCIQLLATWDALASRIKHKMNAAIVDTSENTALKQRFELEKCSSLILFRLGKMYEYSLTETTVKSLMNFVDGWYKNVKATPVPVELSPFDRFTDNIAKMLKYYLKDDTTRQNLLMAGCSMLTVLVLLICWVRSRRGVGKEAKKTNKKKD